MYNTHSVSYASLYLVSATLFFQVIDIKMYSGPISDPDTIFSHPSEQNSNTAWLM
jgi:hypothetical protein